MSKDVFTAGEIAKIFRTSRQTVNRWLNHGELTGFRPTETAIWKVTRKELVKFMKKNGIPLEFINGDKIKILIVDDEINMVKSIIRFLKDDDRFILDSANSGFKAGTKLEGFKPDIVILDIFLGDMDGREFFKYIREHDELGEIKVIGISGKLGKSDVEKVLNMGFDDFLQKPFEIGDLKEKILRVGEE